MVVLPGSFTMKLFVDDLRSAPDATWVVARTADEAIEYLSTGQVVELSLDHDLGHPKKDGLYIVNWIERSARKGDLQLPVVLIHSANPVGRYNMERTLRAIRRFIGE